MSSPRAGRVRSLLVPLALLGALSGGAPARADDRMPGEVAELTDKTRADAQAQVDLIVKGTGDAAKPRRALLLMGPAVWPVVDNALRLTPPDAARPHLNFLKAMLLKKADPEFEYLRTRLRRKFLTEDMNGIAAEIQAFRLGRPDPDKPGKKILPTAKPEKVGSTTTFRSADGSIVLSFGGDGDAKKPDAPDVGLTAPTAGFAAAIGGKPQPYERQSGKGSDASCEAPMGFAYAWSSDGAAGKAPGGSGGDAGSASAKGGAGGFARSGGGGAGAPGGR